MEVKKQISVKIGKNLKKLIIVRYKKIIVKRGEEKTVGGKGEGVSIKGATWK